MRAAARSPRRWRPRRRLGRNLVHGTRSPSSTRTASCHASARSRAAMRAIGDGSITIAESGRRERTVATTGRHPGAQGAASRRRGGARASATRSIGALGRRRRGPATARGIVVPRATSGGRTGRRGGPDGGGAARPPARRAARAADRALARFVRRRIMSGMRHRPRLAPGPGRHVPQPRLVRGVPGAGPRGPAALAGPARARAGPVPRTRARGPPRRGPRGELAAFLGADPEGLAFVPNATTGVNDRPAVAPLRARRRAADDRPRVQRDPQRAARRRRARRAPGSSSRALPFPIAIRRRGRSRRSSRAVTPRTRLAVISHVTSPTALVLPIERIVRELDARGIDTLVDGAHAPGMVPLDLDALGAAYWTGNGHKWLCGPEGRGRPRASGRTGATRIHPLVVIHGANDAAADRPRFRAGVRLDRHRRPDARSWRCPRRSDWMAGLEPGRAGRRSWPRTARSRSPARRPDRRALWASTPPAPDSMSGRWRRCPSRASGDEAAAEASSVDSRRRIGIQVPIGGWPVPRGPDRAATRDAGPDPDLRPALQRAGRLRAAGRGARPEAWQAVAQRGA